MLSNVFIAKIIKGGIKKEIKSPAAAIKAGVGA
jgi:hypothetical protein